MGRYVGIIDELRESLNAEMEEKNYHFQDTNDLVQQHFDLVYYLEGLGIALEEFIENDEVKDYIANHRYQLSGSDKRLVGQKSYKFMGWATDNCITLKDQNDNVVTVDTQKMYLYAGQNCRDIWDAAKDVLISMKVCENLMDNHQDSGDDLSTDIEELIKSLDNIHQLLANCSIKEYYDEIIAPFVGP